MQNPEKMVKVYTEQMNSKQKELDEADASPYEATTPIPHPSRAMMRPVVLHPGKGVLNMLRHQGRACFRWGQKER